MPSQITMTGQMIEVRVRKPHDCAVCGRLIPTRTLALRYACYNSAHNVLRYHLTCNPERTEKQGRAGALRGHRKRLRTAKVLDALRQQKAEPLATEARP